MAITSSNLKFYKSLHSVDASVDNGNTHDLAVDSLGLGISANEIESGQVHNLFDAVASAEAVDGRVEYRCIYVKNEHATQTLYDAVVYIAVNTVSESSEVTIGLDPVAVNGEDSAIALDDESDSSNELNAVVFAVHSTPETGLKIGNLLAGEQRAVWIKREILAGATAGQEFATIGLRGDTDA